MAAATASAMVGSKGAPSWIVFIRLLKAVFGSRDCISASLKTFDPKMSFKWFVLKSTLSSLCLVMAIALIASWRAFDMKVSSCMNGWFDRAGRQIIAKRLQNVQRQMEKF